MHFALASTSGPATESSTGSANGSETTLLSSYRLSSSLWHDGRTEPPRVHSSYSQQYILAPTTAKSTGGSSRPATNSWRSVLCGKCTYWRDVSDKRVLERADVAVAEMFLVAVAFQLLDSS
ncbi:hypothetical protein KL928_003529 [Ogataea angusta]|uniref:Uncharacterized protein n=1 Tax=Pichia angusta TaxID=870730 RepID=A0AAN6I4E3_PICAN|nr:uncharacterized protein KL928_003529 [Ogataea angusta]KAG7817630.1 hypothetical protein KL928_003529 [Ogataea angusta]